MCADLISSWIRRSSDLTYVKRKWLLCEQLVIKASVTYELVMIMAAYLTRRRLVHASDGSVDDYGFERGINEKFWCRKQRQSAPDYILIA